MRPPGNKILCSTVSDCTSVRSTNRKHKAPKHIRKLQQLKLKLWRKFKSNGDHISKAAYNNCCKELSKQVKDLAIERERKLIKDGSITALFNYVRSQTSSIRSFPPLKVNSDLVLDNRDKANAFNQVFAKNFIVDNGNTPSLSPRSTYPHCNSVVCTPSTVYNVLKNLKTSHSPGPDGFSANLYKILRNELCVPLSHIFILSLNSNTLPLC